MTSSARSNGNDLREAARLAVLATTELTEIVEAMHVRIASGPALLGKPLALPARLIASIAYGQVRFVTRFAGNALDRVLDRVAPLLGESAPGPERDAIVAALNGVCGDWLARAGSPLAIAMRLRREGSGPRVVVLVHGSGSHDRQWRWQGHDHGGALARDDGWTPVYVRYNSGLALADNGRLLAEHLEVLADAEEIALIGHSMGGLVARWACHFAEAEGRSWRAKLRALVTLGSPHQGAPLERAGAVIDGILPLSGYSAPLARLGTFRSAGIKDLRRGVDLPLPADVACHAVAAGDDRLVPIASAHGPFPKARCSIVEGIGHLDLLCSPEAYRTIREALRAPC